MTTDAAFYGPDDRSPNSVFFIENQMPNGRWLIDGSYDFSWFRTREEAETFAASLYVEGIKWRVVEFRRMPECSSQKYS
jgi:hypothetical protein